MLGCQGGLNCEGGETVSALVIRLYICSGNVTCAAVNEICMQSWTSCNNDDFEKQSNQKPCTKNNSDLYYALNICETPQIISFMHVPSSQFEC